MDCAIYLREKCREGTLTAVPAQSQGDDPQAYYWGAGPAAGVLAAEYPAFLRG